MLDTRASDGIPVTRRSFRNDEADWWAVRDLLVRTMATTPPSWNWDIRRWDGWRFHGNPPEIDPATAARIALWETDRGVLVGVAHPEDGGDVYCELDPDFRHLQDAMFAWAEDTLAIEQDGRRSLQTPVWEYDLPCRQLLEARGWTRTDDGWWNRRLRFGRWRLPVPEVAGGYTMTTTSEATLDADAERMAALLNAAFGRTFHTAAEYRTFMTRSPSFRHDLNLVAVAPDGSFAAHVGVTYDETNRDGIFEPVCTLPDHRRRGLAQALMFEGVRRLRALGASTAAVETGDQLAANALYDACGFTEAYHARWWRFEAPVIA
jgi:mycothiol synthase